MGKYILKRVAYMLLTLWIVITITFFLMHAIPGDPVSSMAKALPEQIKKNYYEKYGLNEPVTTQYFKFMKNAVLHGDLGESLKYPGRSVTKTVIKHSAVSGRLGIQALVIGFSIGIILGIIAALKRNTWPDYVVMTIAILGVTVPIFVTAAVFQYLFTAKYRLFPTTGWGAFKHTVLPTIALCFGSIATYARYMRSSVLEVVNQDYILTAEAKGVNAFNIIKRHIVRNAILPCITLLGPQIGAIFIGSFVIERIFAIPGLGFYFVSSISDRDFTMILGNTIFYAFVFIVSILAVDIVYGFIDPRIRLSNKDN